MTPYTAIQPWYVYMVRCSDGTLYTGITPTVAKRIATHNAGKGAKYTRGRTPVTLIFCKECPTKGSALQEEAALKRLSRGKKQELSLSWESPS